MKCILDKLPADSFNWSRWRKGIAIWREIGAACIRNIIEKKNVLRKYAVGYISGGQLFCRPKPDEVAVMFLIDGEFCWTHFRKGEFENVFFERDWLLYADRE